jgi:hypothetical protein
MALSEFWNNYALLLTFVSVLVTALVINWVASRRSASVFSILWGLAPLMLFGLGMYTQAQNVECDTPGACEWVGLGYVVALFAVIAAGLIYLVLALLMRFLLRRFAWRGTVLLSSAGSEVKTAAFLFGMAGLGLALAILLTLVLRSGLLARWHPLAIPVQIEPRPGVRPEQAALPTGVAEAAEHILLASPGSVYIESDQGRVLGARLQESRVSGTLTSVDWRVETGPPQTQARSNDRDCTPQMIVLPPPGTIVDRVRDRNCGRGDYYQTEYAILADGSLWRWRNHLRLYSFLRIPVVVGPLAGLLLGIGLAIRSTQSHTGGIAEPETDDPVTG